MNLLYEAHPAAVPLAILLHHADADGADADGAAPAAAAATAATAAAAVAMLLILLHETDSAAIIFLSIV